MTNDVSISVTGDTATPDLANLKLALSPAAITRAVGAECTKLAQAHIRNLPPNSRGWKSLGFWEAAARGTAWEKTSDGVAIMIDNENAPGAMKHKFHGGTIHAKDHLLSIPARQEFYGVSPTNFTNLRFVAFKSGAMAFVIGRGGVGRVNFETGAEHNVKGAGARSAMMVAYWLRESVYQAPNPGVIPKPEEFANAALSAISDLLAKRARN